MFIFFLFSPSARPQFIFFLPHFGSPLMALLLKDCLLVAVFKQESNSFPAMSRTLLLSYTRVQQRNVLESHFAACEKVRQEVEEMRVCRNGILGCLSTCYTVSQSIGIPLGSIAFKVCTATSRISALLKKQGQGPSRKGSDR